MKSPVVRIYFRVRLPDCTRCYLDPVLSGNGKLKPGMARRGGSVEHYPNGIYHLRYLKAGKRVWEPIGSNAEAAMYPLRVERNVWRL